MNGLRIFGCWLALAAVPALVIRALAAPVPPGCATQGTRRGQVSAVDARLELTLADGTLLRIAGLDPPQPTPGNPARDEEARQTLSAWLLGKEVAFQPLAAARDRWGRITSFVFAPTAEGATLSVGAALLDAGLGRFRPEPEVRGCRAVWIAAEDGARQAGLGLWADPYYAVLAPGDPARLAELAATFVVAEGRLAAVRTRRQRTTLYFGSRGSQAVSVTILQRNVRNFEAAGLDFHASIGRSFRVRGLLEMRFGPQIEITRPDEIETLDAIPAASTPAP